MRLPPSRTWRTTDGMTIEGGFHRKRRPVHKRLVSPQATLCRITSAAGLSAGESPTSGEIQSQYMEEQAAEEAERWARIVEAEQCLFLVNGECSGSPDGN